MRLLDLFVTSLIPVLKVLLVTGLGSYLALDRVDILGHDARKHLNNVVFFVFNPALVSSNLARSITYKSMVKLWFMPLNILLTFIVGSILGWAVVLITRTPQHLRGLVIGCCAAGNLGNLLLIIIPAVCKEKTSPFGSSDVCNTNGMAYASLSMAIGAIYLWAYVYNIVRVSSTRTTMEVEITSPSGRNSAETLLSESDFRVMEDRDKELSLPQNNIQNQNKPQVSDLNETLLQIKTLLKRMNIKRLLAPSTLGAIAGFAVGLVPQVRKLLIGDEAHLRVIQDTALLLGDGAIPSITLVMGGNLLKGLKASGIQKSIIFGIVVVRYVAMPLIGIVIVKGALRIGLIHKDDALYQFVLLLQFSLPPAMNIGTMTQLFGTGESECSVIMLWGYALASVALTFWSALYLWLISRYNN